MLIKKAIPDEPGYYALSDGTIYSTKRDRCLKTSLNASGQPAVTLYNAATGGLKRLNVNRLVARAYHGYEACGYIAHADGDRTNCAPSNLAVEPGLLDRKLVQEPCSDLALSRCRVKAIKGALKANIPASAIASYMRFSQRYVEAIAAEENLKAKGAA